MNNKRIYALIEQTGATQYNMAEEARQQILTQWRELTEERDNLKAIAKIAIQAGESLETELAAVKTIGLKLVKENQWLMEKYNKTQPIDGNLADAQTAGEFTEALKGKE